MYRKAFFTVILLSVSFLAFGEAPDFDFPYFISNESGYIVSDNVYDIPHAGDWDADGDIDLLVGVFYSGNIQYYENTAGAGVEPEFDDFVLLQADGSNIQVTYG